MSKIYKIDFVHHYIKCIREIDCADHTYSKKSEATHKDSIKDD